ncbi:Leo1-like protein-domain-containing protein [Xylariomycetidae sp. FL2044]|nr:Leo1-like protein-domain-containing protein [Xylariomycetidae sp. FL2044]
MSDSEDPVDLADEGGDDLFGDEDDAAPSPGSEKARQLSDGDLASDHDADETRGRAYDDDDVDMADGQQVKEKIIMDMPVFRHRAPRTSNGRLQLMRVPDFLKWNPEEYKSDTFELSEWDKENAQSDSPKDVIRYQRDPDTGLLQSNALVYRWSDGSMSIAVGGNHYEIQKKGMAPAGDKNYEERQDAHYYAAAAHYTSGLLVTVGHISEQYSVNPSSNMQDEARLKFANAMATAARGKRPKDGDMIITTTRDPELQKKEAELAEKERLKAQRRRENAAARLDSRAGSYRSGGLSIGDLEGGRRGAGGPRKRGAGGGPKPRRRGAEYDSDDSNPSGLRRQNEYEADGFVVDSDEEEEMSDLGDDDEEEDILDDDEEEERPKKKRQKTKEVEEDEDADADADLDDIDAPAPAVESSRARRRKIVDDDDDE